MKKYKTIKEELSLDGKNVVITGGAGFLGLNFAEGVAEMGGVPILLDIELKSLTKALNKLESKGFEVYGHQMDIMDKNNVNHVINNVINKYKHIDCLINSAAFALKQSQKKGTSFFESFENYNLSNWKESIDINLTGTFLVTQIIGLAMKEQKNGSIINIASDVAIISPDHRIYKSDNSIGYDGVEFNTPAAYSVSKAGILALTRYLATYWAEDGVRVNSISPSGVYRKVFDPKFVEVLSSRIPLNRMAYATEIKGPVILLCSDASSYMTGTNIVVDGGRTIW